MPLMHNNSFQVSTMTMHLRPVQLRLSPAELHHPESQLNVLWLGQIFHLGLIQACVDYHRGVVHGLLIVSAKQLPVWIRSGWQNYQYRICMWFWSQTKRWGWDFGTQNLQEKVWEAYHPNVIFAQLVTNSQVTKKLDATAKSWATENRSKIRKNIQHSFSSMVYCFYVPLDC